MITLDFETFYSADYSLSKMTTEEYIRDHRFEVIGVSVSQDGQPAQWCSGDHSTIHLFLSQFDFANQAVISHNAMFDMAILVWKFGIKPKFIVDTLSMARALVGVNQSCSLAALAEHFVLGVKGKEVLNALGKHRADFSAWDLGQYGAYCCNDTMLCWELYQTMKAQVPREEMVLIDWTIRCFVEPVLKLNPNVLYSLRIEHQKAKAALLDRAGATLEDVRSDDKFAALLRNAGIEPPTKISARTGKEAWAFAKSDLDFTILQEHDDPMVAALVDARLGNKTSIMESRLQRLEGMAVRGPMPFPIAYYGANTTGRWAGIEKINLQNVPKKGGIRAAIEAPPGYKLCVFDLSQIELRNNAWHSGANHVLDLLRNGGDVYSNMASDLFGMLITKEMGKTTHTMHRFVGKTAELGCGYGCGAEKFHTMLLQAARRDKIILADASPQFASRAVWRYRETHPEIVQFWDTCGEAIEAIAEGRPYMIGPYQVLDGRVWLPNGLSLYYPNLRREKDSDGRWQWVYDRRRGRGHEAAKLYGGKLSENITQAVSRIIFSTGLLRIIPHYKVAGTVHDELIVVVPEDHPNDQVMAFLHYCMTAPIEWCQSLPLAAEGGIGRTYSDCK